MGFSGWVELDRGKGNNLLNSSSVSIIIAYLFWPLSVVMYLLFTMSLWYRLTSGTEKVLNKHPLDSKNEYVLPESFFLECRRKLKQAFADNMCGFMYVRKKIKVISSRLMECLSRICVWEHKS